MRLAFLSSILGTALEAASPVLTILEQSPTSPGHLCDARYFLLQQIRAQTLGRAM